MYFIKKISRKVTLTTLEVLPLTICNFFIKEYSRSVDNFIPIFKTFIDYVSSCCLHSKYLYTHIYFKYLYLMNKEKN